MKHVPHASAKPASMAIAEQTQAHSAIEEGAGAPALNEAVAEVIHNLVQTGTIQGGVHIHGVGVKPGQHGLEVPFQVAYDRAGGAACLGSAMGEVQVDGPGWVQPFDGGPTGRPAVLCALPGKAAVAVAVQVWDEVRAIGEGSALGGTAGVGFPCADQGPYIDVDRAHVRLEGGQWGQGELVRRQEQRPLWRAKVVLDGEASRERDRWTGASAEMDLRVRLAARIPVVAEGLRITGAGRSRMLRALAAAGIAHMLGALARRYGLHAAEPAWQEVPEPEGYNNSRFAMYRSVISSADGEPAITAFLWLTLPDGFGVELLSGVDLRVDFGGLRSHSATPIPAESRLNHRDLIDFYVQAWHLATMVLPMAAAEDPLEIPPAGAPRLELYVKDERRNGTHASSTAELIDLSVFGASSRRQIPDLAVAVTIPLGLDPGEIAPLVKRALVMMAEDVGFTAADSASL